MEEVKVEERVGERGGRGVESGCGRSAAIAAARRGQRGGGGGAAGPPRLPASLKMRPARAREQNRVSVARAAAKGAGIAADAASSGPPPWRSAGGEKRASGPGIGPGRGGTPRREAKNRLSRRSGTCQGRGGRGERWWKAERRHTGAGGTRGMKGGAMRVARGAGGGSPTRGGRRRHQELVPVTAAEPSGSYRRPPRGVEPRTLPAIRPTGRPGQRVLLRRNLLKGPSGQPTQAVRMVKAEGLHGLRAKVRGEGGCDRWGHALTRAHARSCLADSN